MKMSFGNRIGFQPGMETSAGIFPRWAASWPSLAEDVQPCPMPARIGETTRGPHDRPARRGRFYLTSC